uniref:Uncharacterized protein n=1 Tax=Anguilla anguilla TaxID=7936 RepID=A0A0E9VRJ1_ANGAN
MCFPELGPLHCCRVFHLVAGHTIILKMPRLILK